MTVVPLATAIMMDSAVPAVVWRTAQTPSSARAPLRSVLERRDSAGTTRSSAQSWIRQFHEQIATVQSLKAGWDGPGSQPVAPVLFYRVEHYLALALASVTTPRLPFVVPTADGGLQIEWHRDHAELEVLFAPTGQITALFEDHERGVEVEEEGDAALDLLLRAASRVAQNTGDVGDVPAEETPLPLAMAS